MNTPGALRAAAIITNGKIMIVSEYGNKTAKEIADLIDRETGASELLEALKYLDNAINEPSLNIDIIEASDKARAAIAKAEGKEG